jgi:undecaprenyl diphosphate synthase
LIADEALKGKIAVPDINEETISAHLYLPDVPDPDLVIRTSGEIRLSNFMLWQAAYSEWYFTATLWPDFREDDFNAALVSFANRERRYGCTGEQVKTK